MTAMALPVYLTRPARDTLLSVADAAMQRVAHGWSQLTERVVTLESARLALRDRQDVPPAYLEPCLHGLSEATGGLTGQMAWLLRMVDAATLAGLMLRAPTDEIRRKRAAITLSGLEMDAAREGINQLCGSYGRGLREMLQVDLALALVEVRPVHLARARVDHEVVERWSPWVGVEWTLTFEDFGAGALLQMLPEDTARAFLAAAGTSAFTAAVVARALFVSDDPRLQQDVGERLAWCPLAVEGVKDPGEAYAALARGGFDLLILDLGDNKAEGIRRCQSVRSHPRSAGLPIVVTSDRPDRDLVVQALRAGARDFLVHPLETDPTVARLIKQVMKS